VQLAWHFEEAGITNKAIHYLQLAGARAVQLSAYGEGRIHLAKGLAMLDTLPDSPERARQELSLQLSLGMAWIGDIPRPEWRSANDRARQLCLQLGETDQLGQVLDELAIYHYVRGEYAAAYELADEAFDLAQRSGDPLLEAVGRWCLGFIAFCLGRFATARSHFEKVIAFYEPHRHHSVLVQMRGSDSGASALAYDACCLWCLGFPDQAAERSREALELARQLGHAFTLADVLAYGGCVYNKMRRDTPGLCDTASELLELATDMDFASFRGTATSFLGEALAWKGEIEEGLAMLQQGLEIRESVGARLNLSGFHGALAVGLARAGDMPEALTTMQEALDFVSESGERHFEAELLRQYGELLLTIGDEAGAQEHLCRAVEAARRNQAKSWELRATTSLARFWADTGRETDARQALATLYGWFTEGFDTRDLMEAKALLSELGSAPRSR
jgi:predicted ATPase